MERTESVERERTNPSSEVPEKPVRRRFSVEYKVRILAEADACTETGQLGELLRREGLYWSHLSNWRKQRDKGVLAGLTPKRRGRKSKAKNPVAQLLATLGVTKSYNRPHVSNDNLFSESQFKTLKYRPAFPDRFGSPEDAHGFCRGFFAWYNDEHYYSGIGLLTPAMVHYGHAAEVLARRGETLDAAYKSRPERFVSKPPSPLALPEAVWINPPNVNEKGLPATIDYQKPDAPSAHPRSGYPSPGWCRSVSTAHGAPTVQC